MAQADRIGKGVAEARDIRAAVKVAMAEAKAPTPTTARAEAAAGVLADARGEAVDWAAIARRTAGDILAHGEDRDRIVAARYFLPARKSEGAPEDDVDQSPEAVRERALADLARVDPAAAIRARNGGEGERQATPRDRLAEARDALARGDTARASEALEGLTDMIDPLRLGR